MPRKGVIRIIGLNFILITSITQYKKIIYNISGSDIKPN